MKQTYQNNSIIYVPDPMGSYCIVDVSNIDDRIIVIGLLHWRNHKWVAIGCHWLSSAVIGCYWLSLAVIGCLTQVRCPYHALISLNNLATPDPMGGLTDSRWQPMSTHLWMKQTYQNNSIIYVRDIRDPIDHSLIDRIPNVSNIGDRIILIGLLHWRKQFLKFWAHGP